MSKKVCYDIVDYTLKSSKYLIIPANSSDAVEIRESTSILDDALTSRYHYKHLNLYDLGFGLQPTLESCRFASRIYSTADYDRQVYKHDIICDLIVYTSPTIISRIMYDDKFNQTYKYAQVNRIKIKKYVRASLDDTMNLKDIFKNKDDVKRFLEEQKY